MICGTPPASGKWQALQAKGKREAQIELAGLIEEIDDGDYVERDRKSLGEFLDNWERDWASVNVSLKTFERYSQILRLYVRPQLGDKRMQAIGAADLNRLYAELHQKISPRTVRHVHRLLFSDLCGRAQVGQHQTQSRGTGRRAQSAADRGRSFEGRRNPADV